MEVGEGISDYIEENTFLSGDIEVVKSSFIFGGNASGKSNVIRAFQLLRDIIVYGTSSGRFNIQLLTIRQTNLIISTRIRNNQIQIIFTLQSLANNIHM